MLILLAVLLLVLLAFAIGGPMGAPWVPTYKQDVTGVLDDAKLKKDDVYIELGCGDGRLVSAAAGRGATAIGYEINPILWFIAYLRNIRYKKAHVRLGNFWHKDLSSADVVMAFLMSKFMEKLEKKATDELKPGTRLVSYVFQLPHKKPTTKRHHWTTYIF